MTGADSSPLPIHNAERVLRELLGTRGVDPHSPQSVSAAWEVFKEFVGVPFDTASDGVLYETGIFSFDGPAEFYVSFLRQFEVLYEDGEHDHFEQLTWEFRFPVTDQTRGFGEFDQWWFAGEGPASWANFVAAVEHRPEFVALGATRPQAAIVRQEAV